jgi:hypothetical protein
MAVADGHGSAKSFRSEIGSERAVHAAVQVVLEFLSSRGGTDTLSSIKRTAEEQLPGKLVKLWKQEVNAHLHDNQFTPEELSRLASKAGPGSRKAVEDNNLLAYGTTILVVGVSRSFVLILQLGDGVILFVDPEGEPSEPLPADPRLFGDETTSLYLPNAENDFRTFCGPLENPPELILISTDGYPKSCLDIKGFKQVGTDLLDTIRMEGLEAVRTSLKSWLEEVTREGSGDDITLGVLCRLSKPGQTRGHPDTGSAVSTTEQHAP